MYHARIVRLLAVDMRLRKRSSCYMRISVDKNGEYVLPIEPKIIKKELGLMLD